ncbi:MAG: 2-succinyl-5-enolpyruvyl-6-hydroxy-3-cyclohexene-1-carboxylic-acid synthase [Ilumatobacteraceae bacterium]
MASGSEQASTVSPADVQATFCATVVDQFVSLGLRHAVVAPGSRSTPMALALAGDERLSMHVAHDERTAAFIALGIGLVSGVPAALLCTSGTAATHFHAAVVEADLAGVPMLVLTADRPPELHGVGAPQTIDQQHLYGGVVRLFVDAGVPSEHDAGSWRHWASSWWLAATGIEPGPVHVNLPFREPLVGTVRTLPELQAVPADDVPDSSGIVLSPLTPAATLEAIDAARGVIVAGRGAGDPAAVQALAQRLGWPVLADPRSGCRMLDEAVCAFDPILRHAQFAADHRPKVVVHLGEPPASKVLAQWLQASGAVHVQVLAQRRVLDPQRMVAHRVHAAPGDWITMVLDEANRAGGARGATGTPWLARWRHAERAAQSALAAQLDAPGQRLSEPAVARVLAGAPWRDGATGATQLVVSSSMPVRDVEWFSGPSSVAVLSNRGANGIDGVIATAIGAAAAARDATAVLIGDVAFCHDQSSLTALAHRGLPLTIVVVDNDGGGIFSFLPQASTLAAERFEQLFGTPHGTDVVAVARAHGLVAVDASTVGELRSALADPAVQVVRVRSDRARNVADHDELYRLVAAAIG